MTESRQSGRNGEFFVLAAALRAFKTGPLADVPSDRALAKAAGVSPSTVGDWLRGKRFPQDIGKILMARAAAAGRKRPVRGRRPRYRKPWRRACGVAG